MPANNIITIAAVAEYVSLSMCVPMYKIFCDIGTLKFHQVTKCSTHSELFYSIESDK